MTITFYKLPFGSQFPTNAYNAVYLSPDNWDDFGYKTLFNMVIFDNQGKQKIIGSVKISFIGQQGGWTEHHISPQFLPLPNHFYSLGQDADYYKTLIDSFSHEVVSDILSALGDVVYDPSRLSIAENDKAFKTSLLRSVDRSSIEHQFKRILQHEVPLTPYDFHYKKEPNERHSGIHVKFKIEPKSTPSSNIHILIGRNGVGKTTLLNNMVDALLPDRGAESETGYFALAGPFGLGKFKAGYFAGVVSVSFSAFDPFTPPDDQPDPTIGMRYYYVGLKKKIQREDNTYWGLKDKNDLCKDITKSLMVCFSLTSKKSRWIDAVKKLESDFNFAEMDLCSLCNIYDNDKTDERTSFHKTVTQLFNRMSSGHAIVLLTITKLVETVEEKTLVLLDEPESHLHPPLLSAFTRALSDLLINRNGVAIIATHSPVVLQEVPRSCVSILRRIRLTTNVDHPENETFAENVGILTREVFGLEVSKSGFHDLLASSVAEGKSYDDIELEYQNQLGFEGKAILRSMITIRDSQMENQG